MALDLVIFDCDLSSVVAMKAAFSDLPSVTVRKVERMRYLEPPEGLDVLYLPLAASERWGSKPLIHESLILPTSPKDQEGGLPPFIVTGCCLGPSDARGPVPETRLLLACVFDAIRAFNNRSDFVLRRVGFWGYDLLTDLTPVQLKGLLVETVPELVSSAGPADVS